MHARFEAQSSCYTSTSSNDHIRVSRTEPPPGTQGAVPTDHLVSLLPCGALTGGYLQDHLWDRATETWAASNSHLIELHVVEPIAPSNTGGRRASKASRAVHIDPAAGQERARDRQHDARQALSQALPIKVHYLHTPEEAHFPVNLQLSHAF